MFEHLRHLQVLSEEIAERLDHVDRPTEREIPTIGGILTVYRIVRLIKSICGFDQVSLLKGLQSYP
jgi:hypothetical protein